MNIGNISNVIIDKVDNINRVKQSDSKNPDVTVSQSRDLTRSEINEAVEKLNGAMSEFRERISFSYHEKTNRIIVKVIDSATNEVVREIPPKDLIKLLEHIKEYMGMFVDESR